MRTCRPSTRNWRAEPGDFTILTLPLGWRDSFGVLGAEDTRTQYYQTTHGKRLLSGNSGRHEPAKTEYYAGIPFFKALTDLELYQPVDAAARRQAAAQGPALAYLYDLRYVVVNPPVPGRPPYSDTWQEAERFVLETLPLDKTPLYDQAGLRVYRVQQPPAQDGFEVDAGAAGWEPYRGEGWQQNEEIAGRSAAWAGEDEARLFLPLRDVKPRRLTLALSAIRLPGAPRADAERRDQRAETGARRRRWPPAGPNTRWDVPAEAQRVGVNTLVLHFGRLAAPRDVLPAQRAIGSTRRRYAGGHRSEQRRGASAYITIGAGARHASTARSAGAATIWPCWTRRRAQSCNAPPSTRRPTSSRRPAWPTSWPACRRAASSSRRCKATGRAI